MNTSLTLPSFAKINWSLRILGKRSDNYHEVITELQTISLRDELTFSKRADDQIVIDCNSSEVPLDGTNLCARAGQALRAKAKTNFGANISIAKTIPAKGGLGGASSNAAIALLGLCSIWQLNLDRHELESICSELGADVFFFLVGGRALGEGIGAHISALHDHEKLRLIVVTPGVGVATADAYRALKAPSLTTSESTSILARSFAEPVLKNSTQTTLHNDFEGVIFEMEPEIERAKLALLESGARGALLAGSGSSVFGVFDSEDARERAAADLRCETGWRLFPCDTLSRDEYFQALGSSGFPLLRSLNLRSDTGA